MFEQSAKLSVAWVRASLKTFWLSPQKWMLVALAYLLTMIIPATLPLVLRMVFVILSPFFSAVILTLFREADLGRETPLPEVLKQLQPHISKLAALGLVGTVYSVLMSYVTAGDVLALQTIFASKVEPGVMMSQALVPLCKVMLFLSPVLMVTWFSPMLIAHHHFSVFKAIKSSIAGCLSSALTLLFVWLIITTGLALCMLFSGIFIALLTLLFSPLGQLLGLITLLAFSLFSTAMMLAIQYISYRDLFAKNL